MIPYKVTMELDENEVQKLQEQLKLMDEQTSVKHMSHYIVASVIVLISLIAVTLIYIKQREHSRFVQQFNNEGLPLDEIVVVETRNGTSRTRRLIRK